MKRKGFTLVELLAVIVILAIMSIITIPMIGNVIDESKKKALEVSANGLVEAANYFTISNDGVYEFVFDEHKKGETIKGEQLDYKGSIEGTGKLYIDQGGDISLCLVDDKYYVYKNYNSGIYVGELKDNSCIIGYDVLTNKYVAMLDDGTGQISNVYSKEEVNNLIDSVNTSVTTNTNEISNIKGTIGTLQSNLSNYALQSSLNTTNDNLNSLSSIVSSNTSSISNINEEISTITENLITDTTNEITNIKSTITTIQNNLSSYALKSDLNKTNSNLDSLSTTVNSNKSNISSLSNTVSSNTTKINQLSTTVGNLKTDIVIDLLATAQTPSTATSLTLTYNASNYKFLYIKIGYKYGWKKSLFVLNEWSVENVRLSYDNGTTFYARLDIDYNGLKITTYASGLYQHEGDNIEVYGIK